MMRFRWPQWRAASSDTRADVLAEAARGLGGMSNSAAYALLGDKGDLMLVAFRKNFEDLHQAQLEIARLRIGDYLEPTCSFRSVMERSLIESAAKAYAGLAAK